MSDPYEILGINRSATEAEISAKFRSLAKKYHPDVNKTKDVAVKFKKITWAYEQLKKSNRNSQNTSYEYEDNSKVENYYLDYTFMNFICGVNVKLNNKKIYVSSGLSDRYKLSVANSIIEIKYVGLKEWGPFYNRNGSLATKVVLEERQARKGKILKYPYIRHLYLNSIYYETYRLNSSLKPGVHILKVNKKGTWRSGCADRNPLIVEVEVKPHVPLMKRLLNEILRL